MSLNLLFATAMIHAQEYEEAATETNFFIPSAPAFTMLGVTPELVTRPGFVREFKVDWRIKTTS